MDRNKLVDEIFDRTTQITAHFPKDAQYIMLMAMVEHKLSEEDINIVAKLYRESKPPDKEMVVFTAWDAGVTPKFASSVSLRLEMRESRARSKAAGMKIRGASANDTDFALFVEHLQTFYSNTEHYANKIANGETDVPAAIDELRLMISSLEIQLARLTE